MSPTLRRVWIVGLILVSLVVLIGYTVVAVMLFFYETPVANREVALTMWGGLNTLTGVIVKAWIDNPFDNNPVHRTVGHDDSH